MRYLKICCFFLGMMLLALSSSAQVSVRASVSKQDILIGDQIELLIELKMPKHYRINGFSFDDFEEEDVEIINDTKTLDTLSDQRIYHLHKSITLAFFDVGIKKIPPVTVLVEDKSGVQSFKSNVLSVNVNEVAVSDSLTLAPIKPIIEEATLLEDYYPHLFVLFSIILLAALAYYLYKNSSKIKEKDVPLAPPIPAHELALKKLVQLQKEQLWQKGEVKNYQSHLTFILREYLENRYNISALESTSMEIIADLNDKNLSDEWKIKLRNMLEIADLVKFAKAVPAETLHRQVMEDAIQFVQETQLIAPSQENTSEA